MPAMHEIEYEIHGSEMQFVEIILDPMEAVVAEAGGMMYMEDGVEMETIFGDGSQLRDFVHVDDAADAFLRAGATDAVNGEALNVGGLEPIAHRDLVHLLLEVAGGGTVRFVEWPAEKKKIDIGSFFSDSSRFAARTGWAPRVTLRDGLTSTLDFYRAHRAHYIPADDQGAA